MPSSEAISSVRSVQLSATTTISSGGSLCPRSDAIAAPIPASSSCAGSSATTPVRAVAVSAACARVRAPVVALTTAPQPLSASCCAQEQQDDNAPPRAVAVSVYGTASDH